jgi:hypothetical protein
MVEEGTVIVAVVVTPRVKDADAEQVPEVYMTEMRDEPDTSVGSKLGLVVTPVPEKTNDPPAGVALTRVVRSTMPPVWHT